VGLPQGQDALQRVPPRAHPSLAHDLATNSSLGFDAPTSGAPKRKD